jgi:hypothetical protein
MRRLLVVGSMLLAVPAAFGASDIRAVQARTCNAQGQPAAPVLGDRLYGIRVDWTVTGTPNNPYTVKFEIANQSWSFQVTSKQTGNHWAYALFEVPLDGSIPARVSVDETGASGDRNLGNNVITGPVVPTLPSQTLQYYDPLRLRATQSFTIEWNGGQIDSLSMYLALPTTGTSQNVLSSTLPNQATSVFLNPAGYPVSRNVGTNFRPTITTVEQRYVVTTSAVRTNYNLLRNVTWSNYGSVGSNAAINRERQPEPTLESDGAAVGNFVSQTLPPNYQTTMRPVEAARALYLATMKKMTLDYAVSNTAAGGLGTGRGDALTLNRVYQAALRRIGIPARMVGGWRYGRNWGEFWTEVYFPNIGWVPQDVAYGEQYDPTGTYAYGFSVLPILNERTITQRGSLFQLEGFTIPSLLPGNFLYRGAAQFSRYYSQSLVERDI